MCFPLKKENKAAPLPLTETIKRSSTALWKSNLTISIQKRNDMKAHQLINQTSGAVEWYTPSAIIEAARATMGSIDLDPASSQAANITVNSKHYYTMANDGLSMAWVGNVWLNHPFGKEYNKRWIDKLIAEYTSGNILQACCITFASTSEAWFQPLLDYPICFASPRINYTDALTGKSTGATKGSCITYLGYRVDHFKHYFKKFGKIMVPF